MADSPGVVFDAGVVLQAALRPQGPAGHLIALVDQNLFAHYVSEESLKEYREVLSRRSIRARNPHLTVELAVAIVERVRRHSILVAPVPARFQFPRDPDDEHVLNLAIEAGATYLVSRDNDLLDLMDAGRAEATDFRQRFPDLTILDPVAFIRELATVRSWGPSASDRPSHG